MALKVLHVSEYKFNITKWSSSVSTMRNKASSNFSGRISFGLKKSLKLNRSKSVECASTSSEEHRRLIPSPEQDGVTELPLIPIPFVLLPGMIIPFQIFEFRYRIMMQTLQQTNCLRFGVVYQEKATGLTVNVGCVAQVVKHEKLVDDRFFLVCKGQERFKVENIVRKLPYLVGEVKLLKDQPCQDLNELKILRRDVNQCMKDVGRLSDKLGMKSKFIKKEIMNRDDIIINGEIVPACLSFFVASASDCFSTREQQALLELEDTSVRLKRERNTLVTTRNYLAAKSVIRDVFDQYTSYNEN
ncbi:hypothetical protein LUZ60_006809 [Juncus effusus]|nr:hypothetical protein LUZ60_006809 [Juncus effusus]